MNRVLTKLATAAGGVSLLAAGVAAAASLGGFPIQEPSRPAPGGGGDVPSAKGAAQVIVDANGPGPYKTISAAVKAVKEGGYIYVMHGVYNESITVTKSIFIQGDRGPGSGVEIIAPMGESCLTFAPTQGTAHAVVSNVSFQAKISSVNAGCVDVGSGVFTLKESNVLGSTVSPAIRVSGGTVVLEKNRIGGGSEGIFVEQSHTLSQTFVIDNKIAGNKVGIDIAPGSRADVVVAGNEIFDNTVTGLKSSGYGGATVIGNKIRNNKGAGVILDKYSKLALIRYNEIVKNDGDGVAVPFGANGIIEDNEIVGNTGLGIYVREGLAPKITNNFLSNNAGDKKPKRSSSRN